MFQFLGPDFSGPSHVGPCFNLWPYCIDPEDKPIPNKENLWFLFKTQLNDVINECK